MSLEENRPKPGDRVCAFSIDVDTHVDKDHVYIYGCGVYEKDDVPPMAIDLGDGNTLLNPKIVLDDNRGSIWGIECFFTFEEGVLREARGKEIVLLDIHQDRKRWMAEVFMQN